MTWSMVLPGFDIINGVTIDYMHCVLLGITKMLLTLWTEKSYSSNPQYLGSENVKKLEQRYLDVKPPNVITRTPRSLLKNLAHTSGCTCYDIWGLNIQVSLFQYTQKSVKESCTF